MYVQDGSEIQALHHSTLSNHLWWLPFWTSLKGFFKYFYMRWLIMVSVVKMCVQLVMKMDNTYIAIAASLEKKQHDFKPQLWVLFGFLTVSDSHILSLLQWCVYWVTSELIPSIPCKFYKRRCYHLFLIATPLNCIMGVYYFGFPSLHWVKRNHLGMHNCSESHASYLFPWKVPQIRRAQ